MIEIKTLTKEAIELLQQLIATPSFSGEEEKTADLIERFLADHGVQTRRIFNNIWAVNKYFDPQKPTILLNSHHDTVKPVEGWTCDPFTPHLKDGKLIGLGSNDAGASLVSLLSTFVFFYEQADPEYNLIVAATGEEERSRPEGIQSVLPEIGAVDLAIVGEPTGMEMAVAEKGLMVLRCRAHGIAGHAARNLGENAILKALKDIEWFSGFQFPKVSPVLGPVKMTVTMIKAGELHNVIPDRCDFTVDIRTTEAYTHEEILETVKQNISGEIVKTSLSLKPSSIDENHVLVQTAKKMGIKTFGSPTLSDQTWIDAPSVKMGPGRSERSHTADEFVYLSEIEEGIPLYIELLGRLLVKA
ncbi:MAG: M20 family metallo-hydrolase [Calditrichaeota bacterium]|nr:M20 family metallo-hydrolase [Calditrichota bacterium]